MSEINRVRLIGLIGTLLAVGGFWDDPKLCVCVGICMAPLMFVREVPNDGRDR